MATWGSATCPKPFLLRAEGQSVSGKAAVHENNNVCSFVWFKADRDLKYKSGQVFFKVVFKIPT